MWQKCPACMGSGNDETAHISNGIYKCPVCNGKRIISTIDGKPPKDEEQQCQN